MQLKPTQRLICKCLAITVGNEKSFQLKKNCKPCIKKVSQISPSP